MLQTIRRVRAIPQVPVEQGWDRAEFLRQVCRKAGLPDDAWQQAQLYSFTADVFGEEARGAVPDFMIDLFHKYLEDIGLRVDGVPTYEILETELFKWVADTLIKLFPRRSDFIARYGGEEFALILVDAEQGNLAALGERALEAIRALNIDYLDNSISVTCSIGIAAATQQDSAETLVRRADQALYRAKEAGRDRVVVAD